MKLEDPEERRLISNVTWAQYEGLLAQLGDSLAYRINYLDGVLEIVAPSRRQEMGKTRIGTLLEIIFWKPMWSISRWVPPRFAKRQTRSA